MKKELNQQLRQAQDEARKKTINTIEGKIRSLQAEGFIVTIAMLMEHTDFSRGLFQKPHVDEILRKYKIGKYRSRTVLPSKDFPLEVADKEITKLTQQLTRLEAKDQEQQAKIAALEKQLADKNIECELLKGEIISIHSKIRARNLRLD